MQSLIENDRIQVFVDDHTENQVFPKLSLQVYVRELHKSMAIPQKEFYQKKIDSIKIDSRSEARIDWAKIYSQSKARRRVM